MCDVSPFAVAEASTRSSTRASHPPARLGCASQPFSHHDRAGLCGGVRPILDDALLGPQVAAIDDEPDQDHHGQQAAHHEHEHLPAL